MARDVRAAAEASEGRAIMAKGDWGLVSRSVGGKNERYGRMK
jgi:hypothetical protein